MPNLEIARARPGTWHIFASRYIKKATINKHRPQVTHRRVLFPTTNYNASSQESYHRRCCAGAISAIIKIMHLDPATVFAR